MTRYSFLLHVFVFGLGVGCGDDSDAGSSGNGPGGTPSASSGGADGSGGEVGGDTGGNPASGGVSSSGGSPSIPHVDCQDAEPHCFSAWGLLDGEPFAIHCEGAGVERVIIGGPGGQWRVNCRPDGEVVMGLSMPQQAPGSLTVVYEKDAFDPQIAVELAPSRRADQESDNFVQASLMGTVTESSPGEFTLLFSGDAQWETPVNCATRFGYECMEADVEFSAHVRFDF